MTKVSFFLHKIQAGCGTQATLVCHTPWPVNFILTFYGREDVV